MCGGPRLLSKMILCHFLYLFIGAEALQQAWISLDSLLWGSHTSTFCDWNYRPTTHMAFMSSGDLNSYSFLCMASD